MFYNVNNVPLYLKLEPGCTKHEIFFYTEDDFLKNFAATWVQFGKSYALSHFLLSDAIVRVIDKQEMSARYRMQDTSGIWAILEIVMSNSVKQCLINEFNERKRRIASFDTLNETLANLILQSCIVRQVTVSEAEADKFLAAASDDMNTITMQYYRLRYLEDAEDAIVVLKQLYAAGNPAFYTAVQLLHRNVIGRNAFYALILVFYDIGKSYDDIIKEGNDYYEI